MALPKNGLWKYGAGEAAADRSQGSHSVFGITQLVLQLTQVSRHPGAYSRKPKVKKKTNIVFSDLWKNGLDLSAKSLRKNITHKNLDLKGLYFVRHVICDAIYTCF